MQIKWPIFKEKTALQTGFVALFIYIILLCFQPIYPPITGAIGLYWLFYILSFKKGQLRLILKNPYAILWILYYAILLIGLSYTKNRQEGQLDVLLKITLLLWPLAFSSWYEPIIKYKDRLLQIFAWGIFVSALIVIVSGIIRVSQADAEWNTIYLHLNIWPFIPNHYMALYSSFGIFIFAHLYFHKIHGPKASLIGASVLLGLILITSVRIQFLALPVAMLAFLFFQFTQGKNRKKMLFRGSLIFFSILIIAFVLPSSRKRILESVDELKSVNGMVNQKQTNHRVFLWKYGAEVVKENFWFGTGTGGSDNALNIALEDCNAKFWNGHSNYKLTDKNYNYHNSYLQHFATHGVVGLLLFIIIMFGPLFISKGKIGGIEAAFIAITTISFLTESMLERQAGVLFFGFFYNFLFTASWAGAKRIKGK